jgi:hypothetical protein
LDYTILPAGIQRFLQIAFESSHQFAAPFVHIGFAILAASFFARRKILSSNFSLLVLL